MQGFAMKKNLTDTFRRMKRGDRILVKYRDFKVESARTASNRLRKEGIIIKVSVAGLADEWRATRTE